MKAWVAVCGLLVGCATWTYETDPLMYQMTVGNPDMLDECARSVIFPGAESCAFSDSLPVQSRATAMRAALKDLSPDERERVARGVVWIGAPAVAAELAWGRPVRTNRTVTAAGEREQWIYRGGSYVYVENGRVVAIQETGE